MKGVLPSIQSSRQAGHQVLVLAFPAALAGIQDMPLPQEASKELAAVMECLRGREVGK